MGAPSKRAKRIRSASEFDRARILVELMPPPQAPGVYSWSIEEIRDARDDQMRGRFKLAARLAESMRTDDALFVAHENRLAPQRSIEVAIERAKGAGAERVAGEADALYGPKGVGVSSETLADVNAHLADHGVAFAYNVPTVREDGSRIDLAVKSWPIEYVRWDPTTRAFKTQTSTGIEETIVHGDGRWIVFSKHEYEPWKRGAILPGGLVWARHAFSNRDWMKGSTAHGNSKLIGELPMGVSLQEAEGTLTEEAAEFLKLLRTLASSDSPIGIRPAGSKTEFVSNSSTAWQVWNELSTNAEKAAARIYLGTDGVLGAQGGAPGVDIQALFGVSATIASGDLSCIERGLHTGSIEIWTALNFGDSSLAPRRKYLVPDSDKDAYRAAYATRALAFHAEIKAAKDNGFAITQDYIDALAQKHGVIAPPLSIPTSASSTTSLRSVTRIAGD